MKDRWHWLIPGWKVLPFSLYLLCPAQSFRTSFKAHLLHLLIWKIWPSHPPLLCLTAGCSDPSPLVPLTSQFIHRWTRHSERHRLVLYIVLRCIEIMLIYWHHFLIVNSWWVKKDIFLLTLRVWRRNYGQYFSRAVLGGTSSWHVCNQWRPCLSLRLPTLSKRKILRSCRNKTLEKHWMKIKPRVETSSLTGRDSYLEASGVPCAAK